MFLKYICNMKVDSVLLLYKIVSDLWANRNNTPWYSIKLYNHNTYQIRVADIGTFEVSENNVRILSLFSHYWSFPYLYTLSLVTNTLIPYMTTNPNRLING